MCGSLPGFISNTAKGVHSVNVSLWPVSLLPNFYSSSSSSSVLEFYFFLLLRKKMRIWEDFSFISKTVLEVFLCLIKHHPVMIFFITDTIRNSPWVSLYSIKNKQKRDLEFLNSVLLVTLKPVQFREIFYI